MRPFPQASQWQDLDAEGASHALLQAFTDTLAERILLDEGIDDAWEVVRTTPEPERPELVALQWQSTRALLVGAILAAEGYAATPQEEGQTYNDAAANRDLAALRQLLGDQSQAPDGRGSSHEVEESFRKLGGKLLRSRRVSAYLDMQPPNDGSDLVSSWLSGALMLRQALYEKQSSGSRGGS